MCELFKEKGMMGWKFWAVGYCVHVVGPDEVGVQAGIWEQEKPELVRASWVWTDVVITPSGGYLRSTAPSGGLPHTTPSGRG